ncbi:MAG: hypothetical protein NTZ09_05775 [Candidatus Hydrogenedentes bacterium]|nr:hypothetical protein [Candidatus Hydrogenedentota bacterium]
MTSRPFNKAGISLLEVLATAAIMAMLVNVIIGVMLGGNRLSATSIATLDRIQRSADIREAFARDVKSSFGVAPSVLTYATTENQLVLELPPLIEKPGAPHYAVYGLLKSKRRLDRLEFTVDNEKPVIESFQTFPMDLEGFRVDHADRLVSVQLDADQTGNRPLPPGCKRKPPVTYRFTAAARSQSGGRAS